MTTLYNQAYYMLGDQMAAEDITQTVFMKTWQNIETWKTGDAKLITWMRRVATNACLCLLYTSPSPRDLSTSRMPSSA